MTSSVRRIAVQSSGDDRSSTAVDIALPAGVEVAVLIPAIVDLVAVDPVAGLDADSPLAWRLSRIGGPTLDGSKTLNENGIHDGELLMLSIEDPGVVIPLAPNGFAMSFADTANASWIGFVRLAVALWAAGIGALTLGSSGLLQDAASRSIPVALLTSAVAVATVLVRRHQVEPVVATVLALIAVLLAMAAGLLVVPNGPAAPNVLLATAVGGAAATAMMRLTRSGTVPLVAIATCAAGVGLSVAPAAIWPAAGGAVVGSIAIVTAVAALGSAPRLSIALAGLTPTLMVGTDPAATADAPPDTAVRVQHGNAILTGLLIGAAVTAAVGAVLVAVASHGDGSWRSGATLTAAAGATLLLRSRSHADALRRSVLIGSGVGCVTASFLAVTSALPAQATLLGILATATGLAVLTQFPSHSVSPLTRRGIDVVEYLALAALLPLACWVAGGYGLVRGLTLG